MPFACVQVLDQGQDGLPGDTFPASSLPVFLTVLCTLGSHGGPAENGVSEALLPISLLTVSGERPRKSAFPVGCLVTVMQPIT